MTETNVREEKLHFLVPPNLPPAILSATRALLNPANLPPAPETPSPVKWFNSASALSLETPLLSLDLPPSSGLAKHIAWHRKGDYLATVCKVFSLMGPTCFALTVTPFPTLYLHSELEIMADATLCSVI